MDAVVENFSSVSISQAFSTLKQRSLDIRGESVDDRKRRLRALNAWIHQNAQQLREAAYKDLRKPEVEFDTIEILYVLNEIKTAVRELDHWTRPKSVDATLEMIGTRSSIRYEPKGVCLIMAPWNYPFSLCIGPLISALAAGNVAMVKPSELTPNTSTIIKRLCNEVFDPSIVFVVEGGAEVAAELLKLPFDHIFFTGSSGVGKLVMKSAADHLASVTLELGGKSPAIVTASAHLDDSAERIAVSKFVNAGQTCVAPDYVLVQESVAAAFIQRLIFATRKGFSDKTSFPKIVSRRHYERLSDLLRDAVEKGGKVEWQEGMDETDQRFYPTILSNVSLSSKIMHEEIFGPILPVLTFSDLDEAIARINSQPKPLGLYIFTQSKKERELLLQKTSSGGVCVNDCAIQFLHHRLPFGGVGSSGMGKAHGYSGFLTFSNEKAVLKQRNGFTTVKLFYPPYTVRIQKLLKAFMKLFYR